MSGEPSTRPEAAAEHPGPLHDRREILLKEYVEVVSTFRMLTDIRFKLLAFLPFAAGVAGVVILRSTPPQVSTVAFSLFGLVVTLGLVTYNERNDQLYDTLVGRAAALERRLGDPDGAFANRPQPWFELSKWKVSQVEGLPSACGRDDLFGIDHIMAIRSGRCGCPDRAGLGRARLIVGSIGDARRCSTRRGAGRRIGDVPKTQKRERAPPSCDESGGGRQEPRSEIARQER
jgi:hypothetical protein